MKKTKVKFVMRLCALALFALGINVVSNPDRIDAVSFDDMADSIKAYDYNYESPPYALLTQ